MNGANETDKGETDKGDGTIPSRFMSLYYNRLIIGK
jgi:hypothetical protein